MIETYKNLEGVIA